jgi:hypothetical protein
VSSTPAVPSPDDYVQLLESLKDRVRQAQAKARRAVNTELTGLYWSDGHEILIRQDRQGWGSNVVGRLADDPGAKFPEMKGVSRSNLFYMQAPSPTAGRTKLSNRMRDIWALPHRCPHRDQLCGDNFVEGYSRTQPAARRTAAGRCRAIA